ncbi:bifunctional S-methyl-5-thioribose-1-phosphate isomerase/methylthioribulose 1-phosphate dehydratase [Streptomyces sp. NRRL S-1448]|uniref:bifunctional S-methyl-5-thioribose-1-phosphate isomerase/methylthioribulose 1-phosphate dehydratase n=1 Tax=Streptomyces sp. NRRL S-1448 TaxID=1463883 RepID=UPI00068BD4F4|nr:bifunctional S-methyl-5-thioribose-1-phosphate isomerase/methylthioribulose 1-phosphate dehydratase [Streptomyces sp. NRRL S-1448]
MNSGQPSLYWEDGALVTVDQRVLPHTHRQLRLRTVDETIEAITTLAVRGAPAIGLAGALGVALSAHHHRRPDGTLDEGAVRADARRLAAARPTAVNLEWAVHRVLARLGEGRQAVLDEGLAMLREDAEVNGAMVRRAADLLDDLLPDRPLRLLTHCNTGRLATTAVGTALGVILELAARGRVAEVLVDETRPLLQGARLTAWELREAGVPHRVCVDSAAAAAIATGLVDCVLVGADRIAVNGDVANKIGTYGLAVAADRSQVPFLVIAPESTRDPALPTGAGITIEERAATEVTEFAGTPVAPAGTAVFNPAFDVTPGELITAIVSESRVHRPREAAAPPPGADLPDDGQLAAEVAAMSRALYERDWMPGTSGNISVRSATDPKTALITASGRDKGDLTARDLVAVHAETADPLASDGPRPSAETAVHAAVYRTTDARAVIHVHAPYATAVAGRWARETAAPGTGPVPLPLRAFELLKGLGLADPAATHVPVFPNHADVGRIATEVAHHLQDRPEAPPALLIADHGITVWGRDLAQARNRLECLEAICRLVLLDDGNWPARPVPTPEGNPA